METINGLLTQKPGRTPEAGQISTYTIEHKPAVNGKKAWIKVRFTPPEKGGQSYRIVNVTPTGFTDSYGNVSYNVEIEKVSTPTAPVGQSSGTPAPAPTVDARSARIERQSARRDAIEYHRLECTFGDKPTPSLERVKEIMTTLEGWLSEEAEW